MVLSQALQESDIFKWSSQTDLRALTKIARQETFEEGATIITENSEAKDIYIIQEGKAEVEIQIPSGPHQPPRRLTIQTLGQGESFGWSTLTDSPHYTGSVKCVEKARLVVIDGAALSRLIEKKPSLGIRVMKGVVNLIASRLKNTRSRLASEWGLLMLHDQEPRY